MKPQTRNRIREAILAHDRLKYPAIPEHCRPQPKVKEGSANDLTRTVIEFLRSEGWQVERINTTGRYIQGQTVKREYGGVQHMPGRWIKGSGSRGSADISATIRRRSVKIEIKFGKDRQSDKQREYQADVERAGGVYWLVSDLDGFLEQYDSI